MALPDEKKNIWDLSPKLRRKLNDVLDEGGKWRQFAAVTEESCKEFTLRSNEIEKIAQAVQRSPSAGNSPSNDLLRKYSGYGMKIYQLIDNLDKLKLENILLHLKAPEPLKIVEEPQDVNVVKGSRCRFTCRAIGFPYPRFRWLFISDRTGEMEVVDQGDQPQLVIQKTRKSDEGCYLCQIYNANTLKAHRKGENLDDLLIESKRVQLLVIGEGPDTESDDDDNTELKRVYEQSHNFVENDTKGPVLKITQHPCDVEVEELQEIVLICKAEGTSPLEYQWYYNGNKIKDGLGTQPVLKIEHALSSSHSGEYHCTIYNGKHLESRRATVKVNEAECNRYQEIEIVRYPEHKLVIENDEAVFRVIFRSRKENITCDWFYCDRFDNIQKLPVSKDDKRVIKLNQEINTYTSTLTITNCKHEHEGRYFCQIYENVVGIPTQNLHWQSKSATLKLRSSITSVENPSFKIALFVGVGKFKSQIELTSVKYDIKLTAAYFEDMGYKVISLLDLTLKEMKRAVEMFCKLVGPGTYVTLYFVSHGFLHQGLHYLMPWDTPTGPDLNDFLCLEEVLHQVQNCNPLFILMIVDMCRIAPNENNKLGKTKNIKKTFKPNNHVNMVTCYAASKYEQAYEQDIVPEGGDQKGIFSRIFCGVLEQHKTKPVIQIFNNYITEKYREYLAREGKFYPMHPEIVNNCLNPNVRLTDPIERREGEEIEREKKLRQFDLLDKLPGTKNIQYDPQFTLKLMFQKIFSNAMVILLHTGNETRLQHATLEIGIGCGLVVEWETNGVNEWRFIIYNLQRLKGEFKPVLHVNHCKGPPVSVNLSGIEYINRPLISNSEVWQPETQLKRAPTEDEEPRSSLDD